LLGDGAHLSLEELAAAPRVLEGVDLLVLSACDTAVGGAHGAEVDGLGRTMQEKGAPAVLATLWPVDDDSTPALMRRFYELRQGQGLTKAEALRQAQRELATGAVVPAPEAAAPGVQGRGLARSATPGAAWPGWTHPRYWAPFVILGNGR
jgi:CHAT domain-containing protein